METYYDGTKLLSQMDANGNRPEVYMCTTNRTGGKTTYFHRFLANKFRKGQGKFMLLYRFKYELDDCAEKFFKDIGPLFFPGVTVTSKVRAKGVYHELFMDDKPCGYAVSINDADQIKKNSHLFNDVERMYMDEFQSESNHYCADEVSKFISIHTSIARGHGKQVRYVPVYMTANPITLINPYYVSMGISSRLREDTKFLKGDGFVLEQGYVESASIAQKSSAFNRAFSANKYVAYSSECAYLNDTKTFIERVTGTGRYLATIRCDGVDYAIREYADLGIIYCDNRPDVTFKQKLCVTTDDHNVNYVMLKRNDMFLANLRYFFERGCFRFKDLQCKDAVLKMLSY